MNEFYGSDFGFVGSNSARTSWWRWVGGGSGFECAACAACGALSLHTRTKDGEIRSYEGYRSPPTSVVFVKSKSPTMPPKPPLSSPV